MPLLGTIGDISGALLPFAPRTCSRAAPISNHRRDLRES